MIEELQPGTYVVAVSGGVDSMALLDMLSKHPGLNLVVAHLDHGIREDSHIDRQLVQEVAESHGLPIVVHEAKLGPGASEAAARHARYEFLHKVRVASGARAIVTAHHQDDLLETAVLNLLRGTGRRGLSSLRSTDTVVRPFLHISKQELYEHARANSLPWREDVTNYDTTLKRNHVRRNVLPRLKPEEREQLLNIVRRMHDLNDEIDALLINHLHVRLDRDELERHWFIQLPHAVSREILHAWLRRHSINDLDSKTIERLVVAAKTFAPGLRAGVDGRHTLHMSRHSLALLHN